LKEANDFLIEMIQAQILIPELGPYITGKSTLAHLVEQLSVVRGEERLCNQLQYINESLSKTNLKINDLEDIKAKINDLGYGLSKAKNYFQTDLFLGTSEKKLNQGLVKNIISQVDDLLHIARINDNIDLDRFRNKFVYKYEDQTVPLNI